MSNDIADNLSPVCDIAGTGFGGR